MATRSDSKEKTVAAAARLFREQGYHGTALQEILDAGGAPRGSLYFHFPSGKEEICQAALALVGERVRRGIAAAAKGSANLEAFLTRVVRSMAADLARSDYREGCPIATVALETTAQSEVLGTASRGAFQTWENELKRGLLHFGIGADEADCLATMLLSQLEGALLLARTYRSLEPIHRAEEAVKRLAGIRTGS